MNCDRLLIEDQLRCFRLDWHAAFKLDDDIFLRPDSMLHTQCYMTVGSLDVFRGDMDSAQVVAGIIFSNAHQSGADQL